MALIKMTTDTVT